MTVMSVAIVAGLCLFAYAVGSIPFGKMLGSLRGIDVQKVGSHNIGATNIFRVTQGRSNFKKVVEKVIEDTNLRTAIGDRVDLDRVAERISHFLDKIIAGLNAILVFGLDAAKGAVPVFFAVKVLGYPLPISSWVSGWSIDLLEPAIITSLVAACAIVGACYSIWLKIFTGKFKAGKGVSAYIGILALILGWYAWLAVLGLWIIGIFIILTGGRKSAASLILIGGTPFIYLIFPIPMLILIWALMSFMGAWSHQENIQKLRDGTEEPIINVGFFSFPGLLAKYFPPKDKKSKDKP